MFIVTGSTNGIGEAHFVKTEDSRRTAMPPSGAREEGPDGPDHHVPRARSGEAGSVVHQTVNVKTLLVGWGLCSIPVRDTDNTKSSSYHFNWGAFDYASDNARLINFWNKLTDCMGLSYDDLLLLEVS